MDIEIVFHVLDFFFISRNNSSLKKLPSAKCVSLVDVDADALLKISIQTCFSNFV